MTPSRTDIQKLAGMIRAKYGAIGLRTIEERRASDTLAELTSNYPEIAKSIADIQSWSLAEGWMLRGESINVPAGSTQQTVPAKNKEGVDLVEALQRLKTLDVGSRQLFAFYDVDEYIQGLQGEKRSKVLRQLREVVNALKGSSNTLILVGASLRFDGALAAEIPILELPLPTPKEFRGMANDMYQMWMLTHPGSHTDWSHELEEQLVLACQGMTWQDAEDAITLAAYSVDGYKFAMVDIVQQTKQDRVKSVRGLEVINVTKSMGDVGGLDLLKEWVDMRRDMFTDGAKAFGVDPAKGIMTVGVPGGGKSLSARALASSLNLPLLRVNVAGLYDKYVGNTEENVARVLQSLEAASPCVAWFDEAEKAFATGSGDGNVSQRLLGQFLSWMEDRAGGVVCYFTANQVENLPPELMRMGRLDERFFVGLPGHQGRRDIWAIQLKAKERIPKNFDLDALAAATRGWTGAEIRTCLQNTLVRVYHTSKGKQEISTANLVDESRRMTPISVSQFDKIRRMVQWARDNKIVQASSEEMQAEPDGKPTVDFQFGPGRDFNAEAPEAMSPMESMRTRTLARDRMGLETPGGRKL